MKCFSCEKESDQAPLFEGIRGAGMVIVCEECAENEKIPLIKKPSIEQIKKADKKQSVRERMERLSGYRDSTEIGDEQLIVQKNLSRLKNPYKKQSHPDVEDNYYWKINIGRRRKKLSALQLAENAGVEKKQVESLEKGVLIPEFEEVLLKLESSLGIKLLKRHRSKISFNKIVSKEQEEAKILDEVKRKMGQKDIETDDEELFNEIEELEERIEHPSAKKREKLEKLYSGKLDMSKRENLEDVTLNDLVSMKKQREKSTETKRARMRQEAMVGEDLEIDLDDL